MIFRLDHPLLPSRDVFWRSPEDRHAMGHTVLATRPLWADTPVAGRLTERWLAYASYLERVRMDVPQRTASRRGYDSLLHSSRGFPRVNATLLVVDG